MKSTLLLLISLALFHCSTSQKEQTSDADSTEAATSTEPAAEDVAPIELVDLDEYIKDPFLISTTYEDAIETLRADGIAFKDTLIFDTHIITFPGARIEIIMADDSQDELSDMICNADITSEEILLRDPVTIGMTTDDFLGQTYLTVDSLVLDNASGMKYYEHRLPFGEDGYWKMVIWFKADTLRRFEYEIYPCEFDYGD